LQAPSFSVAGRPHFLPLHVVTDRVPKKPPIVTPGPHEIFVFLFFRWNLQTVFFGPLPLKEERCFGRSFPPPSSTPFFMGFLTFFIFLNEPPFWSSLPLSWTIRPEATPPPLRIIFPHRTSSDASSPPSLFPASVRGQSTSGRESPVGCLVLFLNCFFPRARGCKPASSPHVWSSASTRGTPLQPGSWLSPLQRERGFLFSFRILFV